MLIPLLAFALAPFVVDFFGGGLLTKSISTLCAELMLGLPALFLCAPEYRRALLATNDKNWNRVGSLALIILAIPLAFHFLSTAMTQLLPPPPAYRVSLEDLLLGAGPLRYLSWFSLVVVAPFFEEFYFRGVLHDYFLSLGTWGALLMQASLFALLHSCLEIAPQLFLLGAFLALLRRKYHSLWPGILAHAMINASALYMLIH